MHERKTPGTIRRLAPLLLALLVSLSAVVPALAVTQADIDALKNDAQSLTAQRKELEKKLDALADDKSKVLQKKNLLDQQIANTASQSRT